MKECSFLLQVVLNCAVQPPPPPGGPPCAHSCQLPPCWCPQPLLTIAQHPLMALLLNVLMALCTEWNAPVPTTVTDLGQISWHSKGSFSKLESFKVTSG
jgi:hypothetical protein